MDLRFRLLWIRPPFIIHNQRRISIVVVALTPKLVDCARSTDQISIIQSSLQPSRRGVVGYRKTQPRRKNTSHGLCCELFQGCIWCRDCGLFAICCALVDSRRPTVQACELPSFFVTFISLSDHLSRRVCVSSVFL